MGGIFGGTFSTQGLLRLRVLGVLILRHLFQVLRLNRLFGVLGLKQSVAFEALISLCAYKSLRSHLLRVRWTVSTNSTIPQNILICQKNIFIDKYKLGGRLAGGQVKEKL